MTQMNSNQERLQSQQQHTQQQMSHSVNERNRDGSVFCCCRGNCNRVDASFVVIHLLTC